MRAAQEALAASSFSSSLSLQARNHSPTLDRPLASFSIRHPNQVRNRRDRNRRRVDEVVEKAECSDSKRVPSRPGPRQAGHLYICTSGGATARLAMLLHSCTAVEVLALLVPTFTFGDVSVAVLPARGVGLRKILGFPLDGAKPDPANLRVGCGQCWELLLVTIFALAAVFGVSVVANDEIPRLVPLLHDALDDSTKRQSGILELVNPATL